MVPSVIGSGDRLGVEERLLHAFLVAAAQHDSAPASVEPIEDAERTPLRLHAELTQATTVAGAIHRAAVGMVEVHTDLLEEIDVVRDLLLVGLVEGAKPIREPIGGDDFNQGDSDMPSRAYPPEGMSATETAAKGW
jgi:hypothetical protein